MTPDKPPPQPENPPPKSPSPAHNRGVPIKQLYPDVGSPPPPPAPDEPESVPAQLPPPEPPASPWRSIASTVGLLLLAPLIAWFISSFALQSYQVDGPSMEHTLQNGDRLIVNKIGRSWSRLTGHRFVPRRGDVIIFNLPGYRCNAQAESEQLIKRVIGLPGDRVVIKGRSTTIYNQAHPEGFNPDKTGVYQPVSYNNLEPIDIHINSDQIFVMGDNRPNSCDSRTFGPASLDWVVGKLSWRIMPFNKFDHF